MSHRSLHEKGEQSEGQPGGSTWAPNDQGTSGSIPGKLGNSTGAVRPSSGKAGHDDCCISSEEDIRVEVTGVKRSSGEDPRHVLVIVGNPAKGSYDDALADAYAAGARSAGADVRMICVRELAFDPILHEGYRVVQELEPDLKKAQADILWAHHLVIVYPVWWGSVPALLKGFLDRVLHPGFAYATHENDSSFDKLLKGRSGRLIATSDAPSFWIRLAYHSCDATMLRRAVLRFCGISPVGLTRIDKIRGSSPWYRAKALERIRSLGAWEGAVLTGGIPATPAL
jgi:putative NADPH-quinone reductase